MTPLLKPSFFRQVIYDYVTQDQTLTVESCTLLTDLLVPFLQYFVKKIKTQTQEHPITYEHICVWAYKALKKSSFATDAVAYIEHYVEQMGYASDPEAPLSERAQTSIKIGYVIRVLERFYGGESGLPLDDGAMVACGAFVEFMIRRIALAAAAQANEQEEDHITPEHICRGIAADEVMAPLLSKYIE